MTNIKLKWFKERRQQVLFKLKVEKNDLGWFEQA